jgi:indolepyruvate decarboxylase
MPARVPPTQFGRLNLKPVIFVLDNNGYLIERLLCKDPAITYNDIAPLRYAQLPQALGCDGWFSARVSACEELDAAMERAAGAGTGAYIAVVTDAYVASELSLKLHDAVKTLYKS